MPTGNALAFAVHISDYRLAALIHMHMLDADDLRAIVSQAPQGFDLGCVGAQQSGCPGLPADARNT
jgi:hypothetical protein